MEKLAAYGSAGESGKASGRLAIDLAEPTALNIVRVGDAMLFLRIDRVAIF